MKKVSLAVVGGIAMMGMASAQAGEASWSGEAELGVVATSGNTETQSINAKAKAENERDQWRHKLALEALNTENNGSTSAERYNLSGQSNYKLTARQFLFGVVTYENDRFSGYDSRTTEAVGYGARVVEKENLKLDVEAGLGARQSKLTVSGDTQNEGLIHLGANLAWEVSETSHFTQELISDIGEDSTVTKSVTALKTQINGSLAMKLSYTLKNTSDVPVGKEKTDTETAITLVYGF